MADVAELILARLVTVSAGVPGVAVVKRNVPSVDEGQGDIVLIADGDVDEGDEWVASRPAGAPQIMVLRPEIWLMLGDMPEDVGTALSALKVRYVTALFADAPLLALTLNGHGIRVEGWNTDYGAGRTMEGVMLLRLGFRFLLRPTDL